MGLSIQTREKIDALYGCFFDEKNERPCRHLLKLTKDAFRYLDNDRRFERFCDMIRYIGLRWF